MFNVRLDTKKLGTNGLISKLFIIILIGFLSIYLRLLVSKTCVTAAGCGPVIPIFTFVQAGVSDWPVYASGHYSNSVQDGYRILFLLWAGTHSPHQKVVGLVLSVLFTTELLGIWLTD